MPCALPIRSEEHTSELQSPCNLVCRVLFRSDRKSTRLNSSHLVISYAVFCLKKKNTPCCDLERWPRFPHASVRLQVPPGSPHWRPQAWASVAASLRPSLQYSFFFFNDTATTEIYPLSLRDALPICHLVRCRCSLTRACKVRMMCCVSPKSSMGSEEHTSELQSPCNLVCRLLLE